MATLYLGEILVKKNLITTEQLEAALAQQKTTGEYLGAILLHKHLITEKDLLEALAEQFDMPFTSIKGKYIDWKLVDMLTSSLIVDHRCFPIASDDDYVTLAITNPLDVFLLGEAERQVNPRKIKAVLVSQSDMDEFIQRYRQYMQDKMKGFFNA